MGTCNFTTQNDFKLFLFDETNVTDKQIKEYRECGDYSEEEYSDETLREWLIESNIEWVISDFPYCLKECLQELSRELEFYSIELKSGYYYDYQFYVRINDYLYNFGYDMKNVLNSITNEDTKYYFDMCYSKFKVKFISEVNFINKKLLPLLAQRMGFEEYCLMGVFSNGEGVYNKVV